MAIMRLFSLLLLLVLLAACASSQKSDEQFVHSGDEFLLGDLIPVYVSSTTRIANVSTDSLIVAYRELLEQVEGEQRAKALMRLGDLESILQEQLTERAEDIGGEVYLPDYTLANEAYQTLLDEFPGRSGNDEAYYQMAKAYDLSGDGYLAHQALTQLVEEYPDSPYYVEAQFRRGDFLFGANDYEQAQIAYQAVLDRGQRTAFFENAVYMHGWTMFRLSEYEPALHSFTQVLDRTIPSDGELEGVASGRMALVEDSLRIMGIIFSYLDGPQSIAQTYDRLGRRAYEGLLYERLGDLYVTQERYHDAIATYRAFMEIKPMGDKVPFLHNKVISTMSQARFFSRAFAEKERFIEQYGIFSEYFLQAKPQVQEYVLEYLYAYLDEAGRFYHAKAQEQKQNLRQFREPPPARQAEMEADYETAADYYRLFVMTFPDDMHAAEKAFLRGEIFTELADHRRAITAYEHAAYDFSIHLYSEEAAYSVVLAFEAMIESETSVARREMLQERRLENQLLFADNFGFSPYARPVLLDSIDRLYAAEDYQRAILQSERFLSLDTDDTEPEQRIAVNLVKAHSYFEIAEYARAETTYAHILDLGPSEDDRQDVVDRLAASVYRQAEQLVEAGRMMEAIDEFLRVAHVAPQSQFRRNAEYDAATYLLEEELWSRALEVLEVHRHRFDSDRQSLDIAAKMLEAHEGLEQYAPAARELVLISSLSTTQSEKRDALFLAAEYFEKAGNNPEALRLYRDYAHQYPQPFGLATEVRYRLSELYRKAGDEERRRFWLDRLIVEDRNAGDQRTDRSRYLAAFARSVFADDTRQEFEEIRLTLPLRQSLTAKRQAMQSAMQQYEQLMGYGVPEFTTEAIFYIGNIYGSLSRDIMDSERPDDLNSLELEQYEFLLEEQAYPFEESAIQIHESNLDNGWDGHYNKWVEKSIQALATLMPGRYNKREKHGEYSDVIY